MRVKTLDDSIASLRASGRALLESLRNAPPIRTPQRCKVCDKDCDSVVCSSEDCQVEFYSAEYQEWPEDEVSDEEEY